MLPPQAFLDYAAERILLRKVGGGYILLHRLMLDYFAANETTEPGRSLPCRHELHTPSARFCSVCGTAVPSPFLP